MGLPADAYMNARYPSAVPDIPRVGDGEQAWPLKSWVPLQPKLEETRNEPIFDQGLAKAEAEQYPDTSTSYATNTTYLDESADLMLEDYVNLQELIDHPEVLDALIADLAEPSPGIPILMTKKGFPHSYHEGHINPYVCMFRECKKEDKSFGKKFSRNIFTRNGAGWWSSSQVVCSISCFCKRGKSIRGVGAC